MKAYWGSGGIAPRILDLGTRLRRVVNFTPRSLYPRRKSPYRLCGPRSRSGRSGEEKNSQLLTGLEPPIIQPVAQRYTTELSRLPILICVCVCVCVYTYFMCVTVDGRAVIAQSV
jgi:hypothetical protein